MRLHNDLASKCVIWSAGLLLHHNKLDIVGLEQILNGSKPIGLTPDLGSKLRKVTNCLGKYGWRKSLSDSGAGNTNAFHINTFVR